MSSIVSPPMKSLTRSVSLSNGMKYSYQFFWDGKSSLSSREDSPISFDLETEMISDTPGSLPPRPVLGTASNGIRSVLLHHSQLSSFILVHSNSHFVGHNLAFDYAVLDNYLQMLDAKDARSALMRSMDTGRCHDTMIFDQLLRLAQSSIARKYSSSSEEGMGGGSPLVPRNLDKVAKAYANIEVDKEDTHRIRYAELLEVADWHSLEDKGWWDYAIKDAIVVSIIYRRMLPLAKRLLEKYEKIYSGCLYPLAENVKAYGLLTESLQLRARIALDSITRRGMLVDQPSAKKISDDLREKTRILSDEMEVALPGLYKRWKKGERAGTIQLTAKSRLPCKNTKLLQTYLLNLATEKGISPVPMTCGKKAPQVSSSAKRWLEHAELSPFLKVWTEQKKASTLLGFYSMFESSPIIHAGYNHLVETGRTSGRKPNIQQCPRNSEFRNLFVARPGHKMLTIDYSFIELVTLAAVCEYRFGYSKLADTIRTGVDPHVNTAAMLLGIPISEFEAMKTSCPDLYKHHRQSAKSVNFGSPGGLGAVKLAAYAKASYGVSMTVEEAAILRNKLINEIYPEIGQYLGSHTPAHVWEQTGVHPATLGRCLAFDRGHYEYDENDLFRALGAALKVLKGKPAKADGTAYSESFIEHCWVGFEKICSRAPLLPLWVRRAVTEKEPSERLASFFATSSSSTPTGRLRGGCLYTQSRNTSFQGLAADGAKLSLWRLYAAGYALLAFVHDEIVLELPDDDCLEERRKAVCETIVSSMSQVLRGAIPVSIESKLGDCWSK